MHFTEEEAAELKSWVVKKLEDISDADSDVLADYVLALVRSDAPDSEIRKASIENLEDFLKDSTVKFVDEIFERYSPKSEQHEQQSQQQPPANQPTSQPPLQPQPQQMPFNQPFASPNVGPFGHSQSPPRASFQPASAGLEANAPNFSRKRNFNDVSQGSDMNESYHRGGDRPFKAARGRRGGRGGWEGRGNGPGTHQQYPPPNANTGYQGMPMVPGPGFPPFDPNDPMAAMLSLQSMGQSMGMPQMPGMPPLPMGNSGQERQSYSGSPPAKSKQRCKDYDTKGFCVLGSTCPYQHGSEHVVAPGKNEEYDPTDSNLMLTTNGANGHGANGRQRGNERGRGRGRGRGDRGDRGGFQSQRRGRAEFSHAGPNEDQSITTIVVEQIPEEKFNEQAVREFFSEFGEIVDVTLKPYKNLALVKYDSYAAAKRAWSSPKVIFDNRFVKVYWYKPDNKAEANGAHSGAMAVDEKPFDQEEFQKQQDEAQKTYEEKLQKRKEAEENRLALEKQKEDLLQKQQEEKAKLMERLGTKSTPDTTGEAAGEQATSGKSESPVDGQTSDQTKALRAQLATLEAEAKTLGIDPSASARGRGRGWPGYRGRGQFPPRGRGYDPHYGRGGGFGGRSALRGRGGVLRLDNRPRKVAVSGVEWDTARDEAFRQYLLGIGDYDSVEPNPEHPDSLIVSFKQRYIAEKLMYSPKDIPSVGKVEFSWVTGPSSTPTPSATAASSSVGPAEAKSDGDTIMGGDESELLHKNVGHEVDYDVAEDDAWATG